MLIISPLSFAQQNADLSEDSQAIYQNHRSEIFNQEEDELNDQGYIRDMEEAEVQDVPSNTGSDPLSAEGEDCHKSGPNDMECKNVKITD